VGWEAPRWQEYVQAMLGLGGVGVAVAPGVGVGSGVGAGPGPGPGEASQASPRPSPSESAWSPEPWGESPTSVDLVFGWNSVCYTGQTKDAEAATEGIANRLAIAYTLAPGQAWKRFVPGRPEVSNLSHLDRFTSILILVTQEGGAQWVFDS